jgi:hypothetical protein
MTIQVDSREKAHAITRILEHFRASGVKYYISKLYIGDYMNLDNPRVIVDRKQNLDELCGNVCRQHERFRAELIRAQENGIRLIILCEHGHGIKSLDDVLFWRNPRARTKKLINGRWVWTEQKVMHGDTLYKILCTMQRKYGVSFLFCDKAETGRRIVEILSNDEH